MMSPEGATELSMQKTFFCACNIIDTANSHDAKALCRSGLRLEKEGNVAEASNNYLEYLAAIQFKFLLLDVHALYNNLKEGDKVAGKIIEVVYKGKNYLTYNSDTVMKMEPF